MDDLQTIKVALDSDEDDDTLRIEVLDEVDFDLPLKNPFARGSDPRVATCRGRLQNRRCQLNQEINKELRLRAGAENLFKATTNRKLKETVALELSFVNSNLQLLKEQLAELNSSVELYQNDSKDSVVPMVPLGLKETKDVDFREPFKDFILEHYSEEATKYEDAISDFMDMRQAMRTPVRSASGVALLFRYYNQLYFIERRFFPPDRSLGIYFEWFDSLTGVPSCQRTVAFEKACVLFNMAAIYTQIGAKQERRDCDGLDAAVDALLRAAGTLRYIHENFTNAPSVDLSADMLDTLVNLMMAQARECLFEKLQIQAKQDCSEKDRELCDDLDLCLDLCQESSQVSHCYSLLHQKMQSEHVFHYVPYSWVSLVHVKTEFYKGLAHHHCATGLLNAATTKSSTERLSQLHSADGGKNWNDWTSAPRDRNVDGRPLSGPYFPYKEEDRVSLGKAHLTEALGLYEEAMRLQRMCRELKAKDCLYRVLREHQDRAYRESSLLEDCPDFLELIEAPAIQPSTKFQLSLTSPDFAQHRVDDLFRSLGPVAIFSAKRHWSAPRLIHLQKSAKHAKLHRRESDARKDRGRSANKQFTTEDGEILRNGLRALRNVSAFEKRDRSEDNSAYYLHKDVIRNDEKYANEKSDSTYDVRKKYNGKVPITKQNGLYINGYNNSVNSPEYRRPNGHPMKKSPSSNGLNYSPPEKIVNKARSKNDLSSNGKLPHDIVIFKNGHPVKNGDLLRRVSSDFSLSLSAAVVNERTQDGYGFSVRGDAPVIIAGVEPNSLADMGGMKEGDFIVAIGDKDVKWWPHDEVVNIIKASGDSLSLKLVTPMDRNYLKQSSPLPNHPTHKDGQPGSNPGSLSAASSSSGGSTGGRATVNRTSARRAPSWNPFKRNINSRDSSSNRGSHSTNVIFR